MLPNPASTHNTEPTKIALSQMELPRLSATIADVLRAANDPDISTAALSVAIARDQAMTLRLLAIANSPFYGCPRKIESVRSAVALLGTKQVQNIASALALGPSFKSALGPGLWRHGLSCALWSDRIVQHLGIGNVDSLFTAALLHDIGMVMLVQYAPERAMPCLAATEASGRPLDEVEREQLGWDHAELGAHLCKHWRLPARISGLIELHEQLPAPDDLGHAILALSDTLARETGTPELPWMIDRGVPHNCREHALAACGLGDDDLDELLLLRNEVAAEIGAFN